MQPTAASCGICGNGAGNRLHQAREMMLGTRVPSTYLECGGCGCLQRLGPPADSAEAYPSGYYSLASVSASESRALRRRARAIRTTAALRLPPRVVEAGIRRRLLPTHARWLSGLGLDRRSSILDVGSGNGKLIAELYDAGFTDLTGVDPHIDETREVRPGQWNHRGELADIERRFALVMLHHSLEHMADQHLVLREVARRLTPSGVALVRIPLADSFAWERYGPDWVALDPPRHLFVHTEKSLELAAAGAGLSVVRRFRDSVAMQFWASEQYRAGIPLMAENSYFRDPASSRFDGAQIAEFESRARRLNAEGRGDWGGFLLARGRPYRAHGTQGRG